MNTPIAIHPGKAATCPHVPQYSPMVRKSPFLTKMLLNVHLPRVVLVHDAEDFVDQTAFLLQDAATSVENPTVLSWESPKLRGSDRWSYSITIILINSYC